ncbi:hypothetical protein ACLOJK_022403 [Asimina triloba]
MKDDAGGGHMVGGAGRRGHRWMGTRVVGYFFAGHGIGKMSREGDDFPLSEFQSVRGYIRFEIQFSSDMNSRARADALSEYLKIAGRSARLRSVRITHAKRKRTIYQKGFHLIRRAYKIFCPCQAAFNADAFDISVRNDKMCLRPHLPRSSPVFLHAFATIRIQISPAFPPSDDLASPVLFHRAWISLFRERPFRIPISRLPILQTTTPSSRFRIHRRQRSLPCIVFGDDDPPYLVLRPDRSPAFIFNFSSLPTFPQPAADNTTIRSTDSDVPDDPTVDPKAGAARTRQIFHLVHQSAVVLSATTKRTMPSPCGRDIPRIWIGSRIVDLDSDSCLMEMLFMIVNRHIRHFAGYVISMLSSLAELAPNCKW